MAEAILFHLVESLVTSLGSSALDATASTWGFKTRLDKLKNTINTIKDVMLDAEERQVQSHAVRGWLDRLKSSVYAADDLFDEFATLATQREITARDNISNAVLAFFSPSNQIAFALKISKKIKNIREELDDIVKDGSEFAFVLRHCEEGRLTRHVRDQSHSYVNAEDVIGRDDDREAIMDVVAPSCVAQDEQRLSVISVVGIGGLGKTTLAQSIYNDERVKNHFDMKLWVCVSEDFNLKEILKKILMSATDSESQNLNTEQLQGRLRKIIGGKKYFLVMDDVWNEMRQEWLNLSTILKVGGIGSKILVTTRSKIVATTMDAVLSFDLKGLSTKDSLTLFKKMAFGEGVEKKPNLEKLGEEIVKKCDGVPLAIITLGTLLRGNDEWKWISIAGKGFGELPHNQNNIMTILKLSYHHLFFPLKKCFAYCAMFPKDYNFEMESLVDLWMAEGFVIPATKTQSLKEVGDEYVMLLLQRCFFQEVTRDEWGNISGFKMHDLMHDVALEVAGEAESKVANVEETTFHGKIRHLSFDYNLTHTWKIPSCLLKAKHLRTFLLPKQYIDGSSFNATKLEQLISSFICLRVLDLRSLGVRTLPKSIGKLIHLRYLNLSWNPIEELPNSITSLRNLQTLLLHGCRRLTALPSLTRKLINLKTLNIRECHYMSHMPPGLGELTSLHKLPWFGVKRRSSPKFMGNPTARLRDLMSLNNLRGALRIRLFDDLKDPSLEARDANLNNKHGLTELLIFFGGKYFDDASGCNHDEAILEGLKPHQNLKKLEIYWYRGQKFPSWSMTKSLCTTLPNLVEICLLRCGRCRQIPSFSQLPFLRRLSLVGLETIEYMELNPHWIQSCPDSLPPLETFFPSLEELTLLYMDNLKGWWEETEAIDCSQHDQTSHHSSQGRLLSQSFSHLIKLRIDGCPTLGSFPLSPNVVELALKNVSKHLTVLKKLTSSTVSGSAGSSVPIPDNSSKLKILSIGEVEVLISVPPEILGQITSLDIQDSKMLNTSVLEEVFNRLSSLRCLKFVHCESLITVSVGMEHLTLLDSLTLWNCKELDLSQNELLEDGMPWKALKNLRSLQFHIIPKLAHLPTGLRHLTKLCNLTISNNDNLVALPQWIGNLSSLEDMSLRGCPQLTCLPEEFGNLTSLHQLYIEGCPGLTQRCRRPNGNDWPKIQHIPKVTVRQSHRD